MMSEEMETSLKKIQNGIDMVLNKAEQIGREYDKWSLDEVMMMSEITKDMSEALKNIAKTNYLMEGRSIKRY